MKKTLLPSLVGKKIICITTEEEAVSQKETSNFWGGKETVTEYADVTKEHKATILAAWVGKGDTVTVLVQWEETKLLGTWYIEDDTKIIE